MTKVILIFVLLLAFVLFLKFSPKQKSDAWYNTSWLYRRLVTITNTGGTTGTEDILIVVDTASLISAGKMQSTCGDLRFADHDDTTSLPYWIEAGCNTSTTQVWVRMPNITGGGDSIYLYYGNPSATTTEQAWGGKFYTMKTTACDTGWTTESASGGSFYQRFPKGGTTGGTTGGLATHNHGTLNLTSTSFLGNQTVNWQYATSSNGGALTHTHTVALPIPDSPSLPPYLDMIFCSTNKLQIKSGMITLFSTTPTTGFTRFTALDNKIPRGNTTYGGTATTTTHSHTIPATTSGAPSSFTSCENKNNNTVASQSHTHTFPSSTTSTSSHVPPYLTSIFGQAGSDTYANTSMIMMANSVPPYGWNTVSTYDTRYPYGATTYGTTGGAASHTHTTSTITSGNNTATAQCSNSPKDSKGDKAPTPHTHSISGTTTASASNDPPYITTVFIQRKISKTTSVGPEAEMYQIPNTPSNLLTSGMTNPTAVTGTPYFSAIFSDPNTADTGNYYEILVNTASDGSGTTMWSTGQTAITPIANGARSSDITYAGSPLARDGTTYYWKIRFWDNDGYASNWSSVASFTMKANQAPTFTSISNNSPKNPGGTVTFSSVASDPDGDNIKLVVCKTAGVTGTECDGGAEDTLCTSVASTSNPSCNAILPTVIMHGTHNAYPYIFDTVGAASTSTPQGTATTYTVNNVAPIVSSVVLNNGSSIILTANTTTPVTITATVSDNNGCSGGEISSVVAYAYRSGIGATGCSTTTNTDYNYCYPEITCTLVEGTCTGTTDGSAEYTCTTNLQYFADPTDDGSKYPTETWFANVKATDNNSLSSSTQTSSGIELNSIVGFTTGTTVDYGALIPGQKHDPLNRTTVVTDTGNVGLNIEISATAMCTDYPTCTAGTPIAPENQRYASAASTAYSSGTAITATPTLTNIYVQKPTTTTPTSSTLWLGNNVPAGINSGAYQGKMTITCGRSNPTNW